VLDIEKYQKIEAIQELQADYDMRVCELDATMHLNEDRIQGIEKRMKIGMSANDKIHGYLRLMNLKRANGLAEMRVLTYAHYQDSLREKMKDLQ
jgi:hypothetical protein